MKSLGIVRSIDRVGRIVLPNELRKELDLLEEDSAVEIFTNDNQIILQKYAPSCVFCRSMDSLVEFNSKKVCGKCIDKCQKLHKLHYEDE